MVTDWLCCAVALLLFGKIYDVASEVNTYVSSSKVKIKYALMDRGSSMKRYRFISSDLFNSGGTGICSHLLTPKIHSNSSI